MRDDHKEDISIFRKTVDVDEALKNQVVATIEKLYLKELQDFQTDMIIMTVAKIMTHLLHPTT